MDNKLKKLTQEEFEELYNSGCKTFKNLDLSGLVVTKLMLENGFFEDTIFINVNFTNIKHYSYLLDIII
jgi:hypothetical protein